MKTAFLLSRFFHQSIEIPSEITMFCSFNHHIRWGPSSLAKLVNITPISLWFMVYITIVNGGYKPTYSIWGPHLVVVHVVPWLFLGVWVWVKHLTRAS